MRRDHPPHLPERVMRWRLWFGVFVLSACAAKIPAAPPLDSRPAIIFVHGYYGSVLRDVTSKRRIFLTLREVLFGRQAYSLFQKELATPPGPELEPEGLFNEVSVLPLVYSVDVYGGFLKFANRIPGVQMVPVVYDWREDLGLAVAKLDETVRALRAAGATRIAIVGHSMGGLVTAYYLGYGNQPFSSAKLNWAGAGNVERAFFLGTPFRGSFGIFRNLQRGANFTWNSHLLPAETVASFPASYSLLPTVGSFLNTATGQTETHSLTDYAFWQQHRLGLLANSALAPEFLRARETFTRTQLERTAALFKRLEFAGAPPPAALAITNVVNHNLDTADLAYLDQGGMYFDVDNLKPLGLDQKKLFSPGDGTVPASSSVLPPALAKHAQVIDSRMAHDRLFDEPRLKTELQRMFSSERKE